MYLQRTDQLSFPAVSMADLFIFPFLNDWTYSELLIDLSAHYNADLGQDEIKGCRQLPHETFQENRNSSHGCATSLE